MLTHALVAALFLGSALLVLRIVVISGQVSPVWLPSGVALWAVLKFGRRVLPGVWVGGFLSTLTTGAPVWVAMGMATGHIAEAFAGAVLLQRFFQFRPELDRVQDVAGLVLCASILSPALSATVGTVCMLTSGLAPTGLAGEVWWVWWLGNAMGALVMAPPLLALRRVRWRPASRARAAEFIALAVLLAISSVIVFGGVIPKEETLYTQSFLLFPPAAWAALRFGPRGAALATFAIATLAVIGTSLGRGPFAEQVVVEGVVVLQLFMAALSITTLLLAAAFSERERANAQLILSERMASMGLLAAGVGHEINNPLTFVFTNLRIAEEEVASLRGLDPARARRIDALLRDVRTGSERVGQIVRSLKVFSRDAATDHVHVRLEEIAELALTLAGPTLRGRGEVVKAVARIPPVLGNEARLGQVLLNLLVNAAQAVPEGAEGRIEVRTGVDGLGRCFFEVRDNGMGIPPEVRPRLFDPFFTTKPTGEGTGLGLFICRQIVTEHGGHIEVSGAPGEGATFRVVLPPAPEPETEAEIAPPPPPLVRPVDPQPRRGRILIVDDEIRLAASIRLLLSSSHDAEVCHSGQEALERLSSGAGFDVVLCDIHMPDLTGIDVYSRLETLRPDLLPRFVFMSGGAYTGQSRAFVETTDRPVLEKPIAPEQLMDMIDRQVRGLSDAQPSTQGSLRPGA